MREVLVIGVVLMTACGGGGGGAGKKPGDEWFTGVAAGSGGFSGSVDIVLFSDAYADRRPPGSPGSTPGSHDAVGTLYVSGGPTVQLSGTWSDDGSFTVSGDGFTFDGNASGDDAGGSFTGPDGVEGDFGGEDAADGLAARFCGTYDGDGSGTWNFVVGSAGGLSGAFAGTASGSLDGTVDGSGISLRWTGEAFADPASGTAMGTNDGAGTVTGTWQGQAGGVDVGGTWMSDLSCPGPSGGPALEPEASCPCDHVPLPPAGACCPGGPFGSYCCYSQF